LLRIAGLGAIDGTSEVVVVDLVALARFAAALLPPAQGHYMPCVAPVQPLMKILKIARPSGEQDGKTTRGF
jgi:hypothetical protein